MTKDYLKNDYLAVSVKRGLAEEIKSAYRVFGWRLEEERTDKRYDDLVHMNFVRDHRIEGKDRLQLLQVRFDVAINFMGKVGGRIGLRALCAGLILALIGVAFIVCGALILINFTSKVPVACGVALISAGAAAIILSVLSARLLYGRDKRTYNGALAVIAENIRSTVKEASLITGILPAGAHAESLAERVVQGVQPQKQSGGEAQNGQAEDERAEGGDEN